MMTENQTISTVVSFQENLQDPGTQNVVGAPMYTIRLMARKAGSLKIVMAGIKIRQH